MRLKQWCMFATFAGLSTVAFLFADPPYPPSSREEKKILWSLCGAFAVLALVALVALYISLEAEFQREEKEDDPRTYWDLPNPAAPHPRPLDPPTRSPRN